FTPASNGGVYDVYKADLNAGGGRCSRTWANTQAGDGSFGGSCQTEAVFDLLPGVPVPITFGMEASASIHMVCDFAGAGVYLLDPVGSVTALSLTDEQGNVVDLSAIAPVAGVTFSSGGISVVSSVPEPATMSTFLL